MKNLDSLTTTQKAFKTHFQLKYTFESHALTKCILSRLKFESKKKIIPTVLYMYSKTTEDKITKNDCSNTCKIQFI